ncbi:hypothetical protein HDV62DRAFT_177857 [Trichoderma sp. SZMC 28011]
MASCMAALPRRTETPMRVIMAVLCVCLFFSPYVDCLQHSASVVGHGACRRLLYCCRCSALGAALMHSMLVFSMTTRQVQYFSSNRQLDSC